MCARRDILLPDPAAHVEAGEASLAHAVAWSQIAPAPFRPWPVKHDVARLARRSAARVARSRALTTIAGATQVLRTLGTDTRVPLLRAAWERRRLDRRAALEAATLDLGKLPVTLTVAPLEEPPAPAVTPAPPAAGRVDDRAAKWRDRVARDPWIAESIEILGDMAGK